MTKSIEKSIPPSLATHKPYEDMTHRKAHSDIRLDSQASRFLLNWLDRFSCTKWRLISAFCLFMQTLFYIGFAGCIAWIIASYAQAQPHNTSLHIVLLFAIFCFAGLRGLSLWCANMSGKIYAIHACTKLRRAMLQHFLHAGPLQTETFESGALSTEFIETIEAVKGYYAHYAPLRRSILPSSLILLVFACIASRIGALIFLVTLPLLPVFMALIGLATQDASRKQMKTLTRLAGFFQDRLTALDMLKTFNASTRTQTELAQAAQSFREKTMQVLRLAFLSSAALEFFSALAIALNAVYIGFSLLDILPFQTGENISLAQGLFILLLAPEAYAPFRRMAAAYHDRVNAILAAEKLYAFLNTSEEKNNISKKPESVKQEITLTKAPEIRFINVSVFYPDGRKAIENFTHIIPPERITLLTGPSGSGKSTLLKLLLGFAPLTKGKILINGEKLNTAQTLLPVCAWCGQRTRLFQASMLDNLRFAAPKASEKSIMEACEKAGILSFIQTLPQGFQTMIGTNGFGLSGGQIQRIALARLFLKPALLWVFDEPTAHIDQKTENDIFQAIQAEAKGKTVILASHHKKLRQIPSINHIEIEQKHPENTVQKNGIYVS